MSSPDFSPCPRCGKSEGELVDARVGGFRYRVSCNSCGFTTAMVRDAAYAAKMWNDAASVKTTLGDPSRGKRGGS